MSQNLLNLRVIPALPRKYEDTKPALNQAFTHNAIINIGGKIVAENEEKNEAFKKQSLQKREEEVWENAEQYKNQCVQEAVNEANLKAAKAMQKMQDTHEKNLSKEISRVEGIMHHRMLEKVNEERLTAEKKLNDVVTKLYSNFALEKASELSKAVNAEISKAEEEKQVMKREFQRAMEEQRRIDEEQSLLNMEKLRLHEEEFKEEAVKNAHQQQKKIDDDYLEQTENHYKSIIKDLSDRLRAEQEVRTNTEMKLERMTSLKDSCVAKLKDLKDGFIAFVEKSRPDFSQGQADFLIPQIDIELEEE